MAIQRWLNQHFELARGGAENNIRAMEGLRGLAVSMVFLVHYVTLAYPWLHPSPLASLAARGLHSIGSTGVDLFFMLSGYLIYGSLIARPQPFRRFIARRIQRIYPAFTAVFLLYIALSLLFPSANKLPGSWPAAAVYLAENFLLLPGLFPIRPMITVAWSLSYEAFYYLAIPLFIAGLRLRAWTPRQRILLLMAGMLGLMGFCWLHAGPVRLAMFGAGMLLHETVQNGYRKTPHHAVILAALLALAFCAVAVLDYTFPQQKAPVLRTGLLCILFFGLCLASFNRDSSILTDCLAWTPLRWLGNMSYSYYLIHGLAIKAWAPVLDLAPWHKLGWALIFVGLLPCVFVSTLIPAAALFLAIERPFSLAPARRECPRPENRAKPAPPSPSAAKAKT